MEKQTNQKDKDKVRVIGRELVRELTPEQLEMVAGGSFTGYTGTGHPETDCDPDPN